MRVPRAAHNTYHYSTTTYLHPHSAPPNPNPWQAWKASPSPLAQRSAPSGRLTLDDSADSTTRFAGASLQTEVLKILKHWRDAPSTVRSAGARLPLAPPPLPPRSTLPTASPSPVASSSPAPTHAFLRPRLRQTPLASRTHVPARPASHRIASHRPALHRAPAPPSPNKLPRHPSPLPPIATTRMEGCKRTDNTHRCTTRTAIVSPAYSPQRARTPCGTLSPQNGTVVDREVICDKAIPTVC